MEPDFKNPELRSLYRYWDSLGSTSGERRWRDFDIAKLPVSVWPRLMVTDVIDEPCRFRARLIGTYIIDAFGRDSTGRRFVNEEISGIEGSRYLKSLHEAADRNEAQYWYGNAVHRLRDEYELAEILVLPLVGETGAVSALVTGVDYVGFRERFLTRRPASAEA